MELRDPVRGERACAENTMTMPSAAGGRSGRWQRIFVAGAVTVVSFAALAAFSELDPSEIRAAARDVGGSGVMIVFVLYLVASVLRSMRVWILLGCRHKLSDLVSVSFQHYFFATFLPLRLGELSFLMLLKRRGVRMARSLPTLAVARVGDAFSLGAIFLIALPFAGESATRNLAAYSPLIGGVQVLLGAAIVSALIWHRRVIVNLRLMLRRKRLRGLTRRMDTALADLGRGLDDMSPAAVLATLALSVAVWLLLTIFVWVLVVRAHLPLTFAQVAVSNCLTTLIGFLPIQGWANLGTLELSIVVIWGWFGVAATEAFGLGLFSHLITLGFVIVLGIVGRLIPPSGSS